MPSYNFAAFGEPKWVRMGPYKIYQALDKVDRAAGGYYLVPVPGVWALPGGRKVTDAQLEEMAKRNKWKVRRVSA